MKLREYKREKGGGEPTLACGEQTSDQQDMRKEGGKKEIIIPKLPQENRKIMGRRTCEEGEGSDFLEEGCHSIKSREPFLKSKRGSEEGRGGIHRRDFP